MFYLKRKGAADQSERLLQLKNRISYLYDNKNDLGIKTLIKNQPINFLVEALEEMDDINIILRFIVISYKIKMGELFLAFREVNRQRILKEIKAGVLAHLLNDLNSDDVYEIFSSSSAGIQKKIIFNASKELKNEIKQLKNFDFAQAGSIMNTTFVTLVDGMRVREAIQFLRLNQEEFDIEEDIYLIDSNEEVIGVIKTKDLLFSDKSTIVNDIVDKSYLSVNESDDIDEAIELFKRYAATSVAVLNKESKLVGILNYRDVIPEILEEQAEDLYKFYGIRDFKKPFLNSGITEIVKSRIVCLLIMLLAATFTTFVIDKFETMGVYWTAGVSSAVLVPIIPVITGMCGNTGSQATATVIQGISSGEVRYTDFWKVAKKELKVASVIGAILAAFNFMRLIFYFSMSPLDKSRFHFSSLASLSSQHIAENKLYQIALVGSASSSISLFLVVVFSKFFGVLIPFIAVKFDLDPASVSAPILTTILDTVSSLIFFGIGVLLLYWAIPTVLGLCVDNGKLQQTAVRSVQSNLLSQISIV